MFNSFRMLLTQRACAVGADPSFEQSRHGWKTVISNAPWEEPDLWEGIDIPDMLPKVSRDLMRLLGNLPGGKLDHGLWDMTESITRLNRVSAVFRPWPYKTIPTVETPNK